EILAKHFGIPIERIAALRQVHGGAVREIVSESDALRTREWDGDALITDRPGLALSVRTADCVPVLIWDIRRRAIGAVHAGWRGSMEAIAQKTVQALKTRYGCRPEDLSAAIGPAAGVCCYEVDGPVLRPLRERFGFWREIVREKGADRGMLDLIEWNIRQLAESGLSSGKIRAADLCTICHPEHFPSYRRDGSAGGGMISAIMIPE
ncbi:MAG TPA: peptidoglycan editing factor PgeF, partial [Nitrospiria bacterium]